MERPKSKMKLRMEAVGMSACKLAVKLELHSTNIYGLSNGRMIPSFAVAKRIADALDCRPSECFDSYKIEGRIYTLEDISGYIE